MFLPCGRFAALGIFHERILGAVRPEKSGFQSDAELPNALPISSIGRTFGPSEGSHRSKVIGLGRNRFSGICLRVGPLLAFAQETHDHARRKRRLPVHHTGGSTAVAPNLASGSSQIVPPAKARSTRHRQSPPRLPSAPTGSMPTSHRSGGQADSVPQMHSGRPRRTTIWTSRGVTGRPPPGAAELGPVLTGRGWARRTPPGRPAPRRRPPGLPPALPRAGTAGASAPGQIRLIGLLLSGLPSGAPRFKLPNICLTALHRAALPCPLAPANHPAQARPERTVRGSSEYSSKLARGPAAGAFQEQVLLFHSSAT